MGLSWEFTDRSTSAIFMDLTITIKNGRISTSIYSKPLSLHLYIPPHSCHAPGIAKALIFGHTLRVLRLCSKQSDITIELRQFYHQLIARGYSSTTILPLLATAETNARDQVAYEKTTVWNDTKVRSDNDASTYPSIPRIPPRNTSNLSGEILLRHHLALKN